MQLERITDQAIRCVLYLCGCQQPRTVKDISEANRVPEPSVKKIMTQLETAGTVYKETGRNKGYALGKAPETIFLYDVICLFEKTTRINRCLEDDRYCDRNGVHDGCPVYAYLSKVQKELERNLKNESFLDLYEETLHYRQKNEEGIHKDKPICRI